MTRADRELVRAELRRQGEAVRQGRQLRKADEALEALRRGEEDPLPLEEAIQEIEEEHRRLKATGELGE